MLYQRLHICAHPYYANNIPHEILPSFIVPTTAKNTCIEYQICAYDEEEFAEHGKASHTEYKGERKRVKLYLGEKQRYFSRS